MIPTFRMRIAKNRQFHDSPIEISRIPDISCFNKKDVLLSTILFFFQLYSFAMALYFSVTSGSLSILVSELDTICQSFLAASNLLLKFCPRIFFWEVNNLYLKGIVTAFLELIVASLLTFTMVIFVQASVGELIDGFLLGMNRFSRKYEFCFVGYVELPYLDLFAYGFVIASIFVKVFFIVLCYKNREKWPLSWKWEKDQIQEIVVEVIGLILASLAGNFEGK